MKKFFDSIKKVLFNTDENWADSWILPRFLAKTGVVSIILATCVVAMVPMILVGMLEFIATPIMYHYEKKKAKKIIKKLKEELSKFQSDLDKQSTLSFKECNRYELANGLNYFLRIQFFIYNEKFQTIDSSNQIQCEANKRRSLGDIYLICKHYYPNCSMHQVLYWLVINLHRGSIHACYCNTIHKFVFHRASNVNAFDVPVDFSDLMFDEIYNVILNNQELFLNDNTN